MNYTDQQKIEYLRNFYSSEQLNRFVGTDKTKLLYLYEYSQPVDVNIEDLQGVNNGDLYLADSPDGWVPVEQWRNKGIKTLFTIRLSDGKEITASHDHLFQKVNDEWVFTRDLQLGDVLKTTENSSFIVDLQQAGSDTVYDLAIGHDNHRYYTNGICSHNSGKSLFLQNLALNWSFMGHEVIYFTLELSENLVAARLDSMITGYSTKEIFRKIDDVDLMVKIQGKKSGAIKIKKLPEAGTTTNQLRAYMKEYEIQTGRKPTAVLCDYLDLMYPNNAKIDPSNMFTKDKFVSEELRAFASEFHLLFATASQLNRCLALDTKIIANNQEIEIQHVRVGDWLDSKNGLVQVVEILPITKQQIFEITTDSGKKIKASGNHKFPAIDGLKTINSGLVVGDLLTTRHSVNSCGDYLEDSIVSIEYLGIEETIDINVTGDRLFWANDILTHNSATESGGEFDHSHIAGGISKINTADNVFAIYTTPGMKERGEYQLQFLKTRSSGAVGQRIDLSFDTGSLRIKDTDPNADVTTVRDTATLVNDIRNRTQVKSNVSDAASKGSRSSNVDNIKSLTSTAVSTSTAPQQASPMRKGMLDILDKIKNNK